MYWGLDLYVCRRRRILPAHRHASVSSLLGRTHAGPDTGCEISERNRKIPSCGGDGVAVIGRLCDLAIRTIAGIPVCRDSLDWIVLWPHFSDDAGHCRRPLFPAGRDCVWTHLLGRADWWHDVSLGRWSGFAAS